MSTVDEKFNDQRDRAEALVDQSAEDPLAIARLLHHLSMLSREMNKTLADLSKIAADLAVDADARRLMLLDKYQEEGVPLQRARDRARYNVREDIRAAEQAQITFEYAKRTQASVNRRHYELMNIGKTVDRETR